MKPNKILSLNHVLKFLDEQNRIWKYLELSIIWLFSGAVKCEKYNGGCEHLCHQGQGQVACACYPGYQLLSNNRNCLGWYHFILILLLL